MINTIKLHNNKNLIWLIGVSFLLFQFFLQLSSGIIVGAIMHEHGLSALTAGLLSSSFYYIYTTLQIPVGILFDRYNTRTLLFINIILCAIGCFIFAAGHHLPQLFFGRLIIGAGSAFAFVGLSHLLRQHFPIQQYALMVGISETLGFTMTVIGMISIGTLIDSYGWRYFICGAGLMGLGIACLCWKYIPNYTPQFDASYDYKKQFTYILKNKLVWINGLFVCLEFSIITVFAAMWAVPFVQLKLICSMKVASIITSMIFLGAGLSCPIFGYLSAHFSKRKPLLYWSCISTALIFLVALYAPIHSSFILSSLFFLMGLCCGAYMLSYSIANELAPQGSLSACTGLTNTLAMLSAPILQPFLGYLLDLFTNHPDSYHLGDYQKALLVIPLILIIASGLAYFLPEKANKI